MKNNSRGKCLHCDKPYSKHDCDKLEDYEDAFCFFLDIFPGKESQIISFLAPIIPTFIIKRLNKDIFIYTCLNENCIGYLDGCR